MMASIKIYVLCQETGEYLSTNLEALHGFTKYEDAELTRDMLIGMPEFQTEDGRVIAGNWHLSDFAIVEVALT